MSLHALICYVYAYIDWLFIYLVMFVCLFVGLLFNDCLLLFSIASCLLVDYLCLFVDLCLFGCLMLSMCCFVASDCWWLVLLLFLFVS